MVRIKHEPGCRQLLGSIWRVSASPSTRRSEKIAALWGTVQVEPLPNPGRLHQHPKMWSVLLL